MASTFLWDLLRCPRHPHGDPLLGEGDPPALLRCPECGTSYPVRDGIVDLLDPNGPLADFLEAEAGQWDRQAARYSPTRQRDAVYMATVEATAQALAPEPGDLVLDAGCGTGLPLKHYLRPGVRIVAFDLSLESLRTLRTELPDAELGLVRGDLTALPFASGAFDKVLCANAVTQIPGEHGRQTCVTELNRVARPGARIVVSAQNWSMTKRWAGWRKEGPAGSHSGSVQYLYRYDAEEFRELLAGSIAVERLTGAGLPLPYRYKLSGLSRRLERVLRRFETSRHWGSLLLGVGQKSPA